MCSLDTHTERERKASVLTVHWNDAGSGGVVSSGHSAGIAGTR